MNKLKERMDTTFNIQKLPDVLKIMRWYLILEDALEAVLQDADEVRLGVLAHLCNQFLALDFSKLEKGFQRHKLIEPSLRKVVEKVVQHPETPASTALVTRLYKLAYAEYPHAVLPLYIPDIQPSLDGPVFSQMPRASLLFLCMMACVVKKMGSQDDITLRTLIQNEFKEFSAKFVDEESSELDQYILNAASPLQPKCIDELNMNYQLANTYDTSELVELQKSVLAGFAEIGKRLLSLKNLPIETRTLISTVVTKYETHYDRPSFMQNVLRIAITASRATSFLQIPSDVMPQKSGLLFPNYPFSTLHLLTVVAVMMGKLLESGNALKEGDVTPQSLMALAAKAISTVNPTILIPESLPSVENPATRSIELGGTRRKRPSRLAISKRKRYAKGSAVRKTKRQKRRLR
jgi:hypothetical protein